MTCVSSVFFLLLVLQATDCYIEPVQLDHFVEDVAPGRQVDLVFVLDQSTHTDEARFYSEGRRLVEAVLEQYVAIHQDYARVAVITFACDSRVLLDYIKDNETTVTKCDFFNGNGLTPWERVEYKSVLESASGKMLAVPLHRARNIFKTGKLYRPNTKQILLVLTDGNYNDCDETIEQVNRLKDDGVVVYTCGIGSSLNHDAKVRVLASRDEFYGTYDDWRDMLTTNLTSYTSDTLPQWTYVANDDLCQPPCITNAVCQCDILRNIIQCRCEEGYYLHNNSQCRACPVNTYKESTGDHECSYCPPGYITATTASDERDDCYCPSSGTCVDECGQDGRCPDRHVCRYTKERLSECACPEGWAGTDCRTNADDCIDNDCENGAQCVDILNNYACIDLIPSTETTSSNPTPSSAVVSSTQASTITGSYAATTPQDAPASDTNLGFTVGLAVGVAGTVAVVVIIIVVVVVIIKRKSYKRNQPCNTSSITDQNEQPQRDSTNDDYTKVYPGAEDNYTALSGRNSSTTYTPLTTSTEACSAPVYLEILPES